MQCKQTTVNKHPSYSVSVLYLRVAESQTTNKEHPSYSVSFLYLCRAESQTLSEHPSHGEQYEYSSDMQSRQATINEDIYLFYYV
jgi:hypothetical protein